MTLTLPGQVSLYLIPSPKGELSPNPLHPVGELARGKEMWHGSYPAIHKSAGIHAARLSNDLSARNNERQAADDLKARNLNKAGGL